MNEINNSSFDDNIGSNIYHTNGSHGCINYPYDAIQTDDNVEDSLKL